MAPKSKNANKTTKRKCMACDTIFDSEGNHHRLCNYHRQSDAGILITHTGHAVIPRGTKPC